MLKSLLAFVLVIAAAAHAAAEAPDPSDWDGVLAEARGETVYFHAWGGEPRINAYIAWVGEKVKARYGIDLVQVKVSDTANVVAQVLAEKTAGRDSGGSVDLVWINGENFAAMRRTDLLMTPGWATKLPNWRYVDTEGKPTVTTDFTLATDGLESPWGMAQLVFFRNLETMPDAPTTLDALADYVAAHPGRFTYPQPPDFLGTTFLKQLLVTLAPDKDLLSKPATEEAFAAASRPVFAFLDKITPDLWRHGAAYPRNVAALRQLFADSETDLAFTFNPADVSAAIADGELPDTVRPFILDGGTIGNSHFVAIPFNANAKAGALVVADFLLSPEAQARKADPTIWGDPTVLDVTALPPKDQALFYALTEDPALLPPSQMRPTLPEPHPSWTERLEEAWVARYGNR
ncbi:ABC transporter substrate-binding protein [Amorphus sp. 3PC139-8]